MVIVGGSFEVEPDQREQFLASRLEMIRRSRSEPGCLEYAFSADPIDPTRIILFERWASQESLDAHLSAIRAAGPPPSTGVTPKAASVIVYDVSGERPLGG
jgi:quinol monooxygenase YgiN